MRPGPPVGRLVEHEHRRLAEQGGADAEPLAHPERVVADPGGGGIGQPDPLEHGGRVPARHPEEAGDQAQRLDAGAARMLRRRVEHHADEPARVREVGVGDAVDRHPPRRRRRETGQHPQGGRLAGAVGPEEAGTVPGTQAKLTSSTAVRRP